MKERVLSGAVIVCVSAVLVFAGGNFLFPAAVALLGVTALHELFAAAKWSEDRALFAVCGIFAAALPFLAAFGLVRAAFVLAFCFAAAVAVRFLAGYENLEPCKIGVAVTGTLAVAGGFSVMAVLRNGHRLAGSALTESDGKMLIVLVLLGAWSTDVGGLFVGLLLGRHKLAPKISPKKTVEGALGGIAFCVLAFHLTAFVYSRFFAPQPVWNGTALTVAAVGTAVTAMLGDLTASAVKRAFGVKDFGKIIPGHGGILDRFDSVLAVAPAVCVFLLEFPFVTRP